MIGHGVASCAPGFMNIRVPSFYSPAFEGAAAFLTGLARGYKIIGREDVVIAGLIGDGGTVDIGFQGLSAAAERNENVFWFTYEHGGPEEQRDASARAHRHHPHQQAEQG